MSRRASGPPPLPQQILLWCFAALFPFWEGSLGASLLYEGDAHRISAELAQLRIPSVLWMLPSVLQHSQDLAVYSGGRCVTSQGRRFPLKMCSLPPGHGCLWTLHSHRGLFYPQPSALPPPWEHAPSPCTAALSCTNAFSAATVPNPLLPY